MFNGLDCVYAENAFHFEIIYHHRHLIYSWQMIESTSKRITQIGERAREMCTTEKYIVISIFQFGVRWQFEKLVKGFCHLCIDNNAAFVKILVHVFVLLFSLIIVPLTHILSVSYLYSHSSVDGYYSVTLQANGWQIPSASLKYESIVMKCN